RPTGAVITQSIVLEPVGESVLFGLPRIVHAEGLDGMSVDTSGTYRWRGDPERLEYTVFSMPMGEGPGATRVGRAERAALRSGAWVSLPPGLDPRIGALAGDLASQAGPEATPRVVAETIERHLRTRFAYTDVPTVADARQPLSDFLFRSRRGHCEFFATALAVLLRARGIPARVVNGFQGGEFNDFGGFVLVRQSDAHSWVEAWFPEEGWVQLDATPASDVPAPPPVIVRAAQWGVDAWHRIILDYDLDAQIDGWTALASAMPRIRVPAPEGGSQPLPGGPGFILLAAGASLLWLGRRAAHWLSGARPAVRRPASGGTRVARLHARARKRVARRGWQIPAGLPPVAAARWLAKEAGEPAAPLEALAWALYRVRYGGVEDAAEVPAARAAWKALSALPRHRQVRGAGSAPERRAG
ncbi:MAG: transglutaminase-like domain-containing protein, partial [Myxococcota bacterium]|nr:transglutaminase-like domain-containing protein [Myxococcota bacterium]